ncbi:MAG: hypothetical protein L0I47_09105 [Lactococcus lactis]|nr:hypothetical protein [Lactococcus lactis]
MKNELEALASELPILTDKSSYKYLSEVAGNGKYIQVAWQKLADGYIALYGTTPIQINVAPILNDIFEDEEG